MFYTRQKIIFLIGQLSISQYFFLLKIIREKWLRVDGGGEEGRGVEVSGEEGGGRNK
jgi:hypothetical protein